MILSGRTPLARSRLNAALPTYLFLDPRLEPLLDLPPVPVGGTFFILIFTNSESYFLIAR